ncbi:MAG: rhomboid family intramembrane serine protease [Bacteroidetes bacterium]|nr:rhomboid family intramembrane serine protease [Bacteroidota bacterium]
MNVWESIKYEFNKDDSPIRKLVIINVAVFVLAGLASFILHLYKLDVDFYLSKYFYLPSWFSEFITKPWTLLTYMFFHAGVMHILFNMLWLYFIGRILIDFTTNKRFYQIYFFGGLTGGVLYLLFYNVFPIFTQMPESSVMLGASGAVNAIIVATAVLVPNYEIFLFGIFRVRLKWIALFLVMMDVLLFSQGNEGGRLAHLGGAAFGALYVLQMQGRLNLNFNFLRKIRNPFKPKYQVIDESKILRNKKSPNTSGSTSKSTNPFNIRTSGKPGQEEIDAILDKISQSGYESLSKEEKEMLFRASE